jgi:NitT/TauT family transport system permease protein/sulfonate transport system permease protein
VDNTANLPARSAATESGGALVGLRSWLNKAAPVHIFTLIVFGLWFAAAAVSPAYLVPQPMQVAHDVVLFFTNPAYTQHMTTSILHVVLSMIFGFAVAGALALLAFYLPPLRLLISERIYPFLNSFTSIGWTVLAVVWFGSGDLTVYFTITTVLVPFIFVNLREGLMSLDREVGEMAESFTRNLWRQFWLIILPSLYPFIFAALRIAFGLAWKVTLVAELFGDNRGFGYVMYTARDNIETHMIFAVIAIVIVMVSTADRFVFAPLHAAVSRHYANG